MNEYYQFGGIMLGGIAIIGGIIYIGIRREFGRNRKIVTIDEAILDLKEQIGHLGVVSIKQRGYGKISVVLSGFPFQEVLNRIPAVYKGYEVETVIEYGSEIIRIK